jgi:RNA polymerase sigma factor (sigma-70 family)
MDGGRLRSVVRRLRRAAEPCGPGGLTDADLLRRWIACRDEAAFEALLWRHATAVLGVCRRVLGDAHEAEDAAQAAFLTLARRAHAIGRRQAVAAWLHTVAYRTALRARSRRPRVAPQSELNALPAAPDEDPVWRDLRPVLDEEIDRLPEKYRAAFVLCHVEGRTNEEAARELRCPIGTVLSRLARARRRLRDMLTRRGVTLAAGALALGLSAEAAQAAVPGVLIRGAVRAAGLHAVGQALVGVVPTEVIALTESMVRAMLITKVKMAGALAFGLLLLGGGGMLSYQTASGQPGRATSEAAPLRAAPAKEEDLKALLAQKEKELRDLQDQLKAVQEALRDRTRELEQVAQRQRDQAERARAAELQARQQAEAERDAGHAARRQAEEARAAEDTRRNGAGSIVAQGVIEQARDEVELLEAQLAVKRAQLDAAQMSLQATTEANKQGTATVRELMTLRGEAQVKSAELKEAEVRLVQARRRLERLTRTNEPARNEGSRRANPTGPELDKRLDALQKDLENLRRELHQKAPQRQ